MLTPQLAAIERAAALYRSDPAPYPHLTRYVSAYGRLPSWIEQHGSNTAMRPKGRGDRLQRACPDLVKVRWHQPRHVAAALDTLPAHDLMPTLWWLVEGGRYAPTLGYAAWEWSQGAGWHVHAAVCPDDAQRLQDAIRRGLGTLGLVEPVRDLRDALAYDQKRVRWNVSPDEHLAVCERLLKLRHDLDAPQLPRLIRWFGVPAL